ncbi:MAG TPA: hypothetical protein VFX21_05105, partial [Acidimicrobiia bacterium]|nr:hypothetical protein [Acidimicrobiia bacterium]
MTDAFPITAETARGQPLIDDLAVFSPRARGLSAIDDLMLPTEPPIRRPGSRGSTAAETPETRAEMTTSERGPSIDDSLLGISSVDGVLASFGEETNSVPEALPFEIDSGPVVADPDELVPVRPDLASLQVVVYEDSAQLATAQNAIVAAGHVVAQGGSGRAGLSRVLAAIHGGGIDVVLVALPGGQPIIDAAL